MSLTRRLQPLALVFAMVAMPLADAQAQQVFDVADVVETIMPSVAHIQAAGESTPAADDNDESGTGSGFVYNATLGYIITNNHVIEDATTITVTINERTYNGTLVGTDEATDVAVLQITPNPVYPLVAVRLGNSDALRVGNAVIAIGAPFGLSQTVTTGIISAKDRVLGAGPYDQFLQTDAAINPGNSGGPLFNVRGEVIGVNTAIFSPHGTNLGIGFSIPSNHVAWVANQIIANGAVNWGYIGAGIRELTAEDRTAANLHANSNGVVIGQIHPGSPAASVLRDGDIVLSVNGTAINNPRQIRLMLGQLLAGTQAELTLRRNGVDTNVNITLGARPDKSDTPAEQQAPDQLDAPENETPGNKMPVIPELTPDEDADDHTIAPAQPNLRRADRKNMQAPAP